jgi:hypothetical protein
VSGDYQAVRGEIETPIPLVLRGVADKDTPIGAGGGSGGSTSKHNRMWV